MMYNLSQNIIGLPRLRSTSSCPLITVVAGRCVPPFRGRQRTAQLQMGRGSPPPHGSPMGRCGASFERIQRNTTGGRNLDRISSCHALAHPGIYTCTRIQAYTILPPVSSATSTDEGLTWKDVKPLNFAWSVKPRLRVTSKDFLGE
jgi:hypothetical protein